MQPRLIRLQERPRTSRLLLTLLLLGALVFPAVAHAQELDDAARGAARQLAVEGGQLYEQQNFAEAYDRFQRAYQLVHAPSVGIWAARSLQKLGRWVEASERFLAVQEQPLEAGAPSEHQKARAEAAVERAALLPRIPSLRVLVEGVNPSDVFVTLNGELLPASLLGVGRPVDPGKLAVKGTHGAEVVELSIELLEGESREATLTFRPAASAPVAAAPAAVVVEASPPADQADPGEGRRTLGYVALGVGGVGLIVGSVFGALALGQKSDLDEACPNRTCSPSEYEALDSYETRSAISGASLIAGAVLAAGGAVLVLSAPPPGKSARVFSPRLGLRVGVGQAFLVGDLP